MRLTGKVIDFRWEGNTLHCTVKLDTGETMDLPPHPYPPEQIERMKREVIFVGQEMTFEVPGNDNIKSDDEYLDVSGKLLAVEDLGDHCWNLTIETSPGVPDKFRIVGISQDLSSYRALIGKHVTVRVKKSSASS